ncbi:MAG: S8 family serine peptidase [Sphingobacteriaceae bacterium]|nr:S8 family serine peptidase [Sphingobacteriaceae bacterium]
MAKVINHEPLFSTDLRYFKSIQIIEGKTIFDRYNSLANIIKNHIDSKYQDFISYPVNDGNKIEFQGKIANEEPQVFAELQGNDYTKYQNLKNDTLAYYHNKIEELKNTGKTDEAIFLSNAIKYLDDRFVYCYDNKVVLAAWGMQLRENVREDFSVIRKNLIKKKPQIETPIEETKQETLESPSIINPFTVRFNAGDNGRIYGQSEYSKYAGDSVWESEIPKVEEKEGYEFIGWNEDPKNFSVYGDEIFTAQYREIPPIIVSPKKQPWWKRLWLFLTGSGCLKWLFWLLLIILLLFLCSWLFRGCNSHTGGVNDDENAVHRDIPNSGNDVADENKGGIYDPENPYKPVPTPPDFKDVLPPYQGVMPPIDENPGIKPGNPSVIANRLNIIMENETKSILDLARDFKKKYPEVKYKIIYYDDVVKRMQLEIPSEEYEKLKNEIPTDFAPKYNLFVFGEACFEGTDTPSDPAFSDQNKSWYLNTIKAPLAWNITKGSEKITVAIVDNGFNLNHPELSSKVVKPYNVWLHSQKIFPQKIDHGTHVAGTALALADNGKGICGVAPNCKFMPIQVADKNGMMTTSSVLDGILYAIYQGADVINVSLGNSHTGLSKLSKNAQQNLINNHSKEEERLWLEISRIASKHKATIVVAAGNDNVLAGIDALQRPDNFIVVSAINKNKSTYSKSHFSNYGKHTTISAPGVGIFSCVGNNSYKTMDGTSMAAPIVAGAVALMKSINKSLTTKQIICILQSTGLQTKGNIAKLIQIDKALQKVKTGEATDCTTKPSSGDVQVLLRWGNYNDLDLICKDPNGHTIFFKNRSVPSGGQLEFDMNVEYPDNTKPIENIFWQKGKAPKGTYNVYLSYFKRHINIKDTPYKITVKYGDKTENFEGIIKKEKETIKICSFTLKNK